MKPYCDNGVVQLYLGDCRDVLAALPTESIHCVITSPPYWGLRDYGLGPDVLGLEPTPELYVQHIVELFREVRRVLRKDGTVWLNLGDRYNNRSVVRPSSHQGGLGFSNESIERSWAEGTKLGLTRLSLTANGLQDYRLDARSCAKLALCRGCARKSKTLSSESLGLRFWPYWLGSAP